MFGVIHRGLPFRIMAALMSVLVAVLTQVYALRLPERNVYPKEDGIVRVMTFNLLCKGTGEKAMMPRKDLAAQTVAEHLPDSFGVQEATPSWIRWLSILLPEYGYVGVGRDDGANKGEYAAVFYLKDKYRVADSGTFWISPTPEVPSRGYDAMFKRICTWAVLEDLQTGLRYAHINAHFDHIGFVARAKGIEMVQAKAAEFDIPVAVTGDFNFNEGGHFYRKLTGGDLRDTKHHAPDTMSGGTFHNFSFPAPEHRVIDYILVNDGFTPLVYRIVTEGIDGKPVSDHYPVYADLRWS